jgi:hypothetical protein
LNEIAEEDGVPNEGMWHELRPRFVESLAIAQILLQ